jgi:hypothetical protein
MDLQNPFCKLKIISLIKPKTPNKQSHILLFNQVELNEETPEQQMSIKITSFCINLKEKKKINKTISKYKVSKMTLPIYHDNNCNQEWPRTQLFAEKQSYQECKRTKHLPL